MPEKKKNNLLDKLSSDFWFGLTVGILGGALGDIWVTTYYKWMDNLLSEGMMLSSLITTSGFLVFIIFLFYMTFRKKKK